MIHRRRVLLILIAVVVLLLVTTGAVAATKPIVVQGFVPLPSYDPGVPGGISSYDVCDEILQGRVEQPFDNPGKAIHGVFTAGDSDFCPGTPTLEGTCKLTLIPVEEFGNPDSKEGSAVLKQCTGDLKGLHGNFKIHFDFTYDAKYHMHP